MIKRLRKLYFKYIPTYRILEVRLCTWEEGDTLIRSAEGSPKSEQWEIAPGDATFSYPWVMLQRVERILE